MVSFLYLNFGHWSKNLRRGSIYEDEIHTTFSVWRTGSGSQ